MFVVIVGDMSLNSERDKQRVLALVETLKAKYSDLVVVSSACEKGIGRFVRDRCMKEQRDVGFVEVAVYPWAKLSSARLAQIYVCKNAALLELGEEFHIFVGAGRDFGYIQDLISRVQKAPHRPPCTVYAEESEKR